MRCCVAGPPFGIFPLPYLTYSLSYTSTLRSKLCVIRWRRVLYSHKFLARKTRCVAPSISPTINNTSKKIIQHHFQSHRFSPARLSLTARRRSCRGNRVSACHRRAGSQPRRQAYLLHKYKSGRYDIYSEFIINHILPRI